MRIVRGAFFDSPGFERGGNLVGNVPVDLFPFFDGSNDLPVSLLGEELLHGSPAEGE